MDKLLLAAFFSLLAGLIAAVISVVKLVIEKENKTSEFRQSWTNSVRISLSDLAAKMTSMTASFEYDGRLASDEESLAQKSDDANIKMLDRNQDAKASNDKDIVLQRHDMSQSYALCKLHFKPGDEDFKQIEIIFNLIVSNIKAITLSKNDDERVKIKASNEEQIQKMVEIGRAILKKEWETVKKGEEVYIETKKYSFRVGVMMLVPIILIVLYSLYWGIKKYDYVSNGSEIAAIDLKKANVTQCWQLQILNQRIFKLNSCTGETVELGKSIIQKAK